MSLMDYLVPIRRWWWLVLAGILIAASITYLTVRRLPPVYQAHSTLVVGRAIQNPNPTDSDIYLAQQLANTYADLARRQAVRDGAKAALGLTQLPDYTVAIVPNTQLIELSVSDTSPARAMAVANELARQLIDQAPGGTDTEPRQRQAFVKAQLDDLQQKIKETQSETDKQQAGLASMFSAHQIADAQAQIAALQTKLSTLQANYAALLGNTQKGAVNTLEVVEQANLPTVPIGPQRLSIVLMAAAIGLLLSGSAAYVLNYLDDTIHSAGEVRRALGLATLGAIPLAQAAASGMAVVAGDRSAAAEAYRLLRTNLEFASGDQSLQVLLVTSPAPEDGKSFTCANLGAVLAQAGRQVVVVDADIHSPSLHRMFGLPNHAGLTTALLGAEPDLLHLLQESGVPGLRVITAGPLPPKAADLLGSQRMRSVLAALRASADVVVVDSPPVLALVDATVLAAQTDGVLLVLRASHSRRDQAMRAKQALEQVKTRILGVVLNRMRENPLEYYGYYWHMVQHTSNSGSAGDRGMGGRGNGGIRGRFRWLPSTGRPFKDRSAP